jgi:hypothetical protein
MKNKRDFEGINLKYWPVALMLLIPLHYVFYYPFWLLMLAILKIFPSLDEYGNELSIFSSVVSYALAFGLLFTVWKVHFKKSSS